MASRFEGFPLADIRKGGQGSGGPQLAQSQLRVGRSVVEPAHQKWRYR